MFTLNCRGRLLTLRKPLVMGILNITPDSFYAPSRRARIDEVLHTAGRMLEEGADLLDIGAQSTRPGAAFLSAAEERDRLKGIFEAIGKHFPQAICSIDTFHASVAEAALDAGASMVNDISGGRQNPEILSVVARWRAPFICMHSAGTVHTMHEKPVYPNLLAELMDYFAERLEACRLAGIHDVILDPGFGFSKSVADQFLLIRSLRELRIFERPLLIGLSRKSAIYKTLGVSAAEALNGTTVMHTLALLGGADILRVHDVREARECVALTDLYLKAGRGSAERPSGS